MASHGGSIQAVVAKTDAVVGVAIVDLTDGGLST